MTIDTLIQDALEWGRLGNKSQARALLAQAVQQDPNHARAWFLLSQTVENDEEALDCLRRVEALQPGNRQVRARIAALEERLPTRAPSDDASEWLRPLTEQTPWISRGDPTTPPHGVPPVNASPEGRGGAFAWEAPQKTASGIDWSRPLSEQNEALTGSAGDDTAQIVIAQPVAPAFSPAKASRADRSRMAMTALIIGIVGLVTWCLPIVGLPLALVGMVLGVMSRSSRRRDLANAAIGLCVIVLLLSCVSGVIEGYIWWNLAPPIP